jgi:hypothetical protein
MISDQTSIQTTWPQWGRFAALPKHGWLLTVTAMQHGGFIPSWGAVSEQKQPGIAGWRRTLRLEARRLPRRSGRAVGQSLPPSSPEPTTPTGAPRSSTTGKV